MILDLGVNKKTMEPIVVFVYISPQRSIYFRVLFYTIDSKVTRHYINSRFIADILVITLNITSHLYFYTLSTYVDNRLS